MKRKTILCFFGTRPEAIKMASVVKKLTESRFFRTVVTVSAQHRHMLDQVLRLFDLKSHVDLNIMRDGQSLSDVTCGVIKNFEPVLNRFKPDMVLVHGDTTTTMAGSLAAFYKKIPIGHVEAGLRTGDIYQPFPEEINRRVTDTLARLYFAPTPVSRDNLLKENIHPSKIFVTGNTVIDSLLEISKKVKEPRSPALRKVLATIHSQENQIILLTAHRRENFGMPFRQICDGVRTLGKKFPAVHWIYPVHPNPNIQRPARRLLGRLANVHLLEPLEYDDLVYVMKASTLVVTDSGGLQEEAPSLGKPVLVLRSVTERPEAVKAGTVRLVGSSRSLLVSEVTRLITKPAFYRSMANATNPYGDGRAAERIVGALAWHYGFIKDKPRSFGKPS